MCQTEKKWLREWCVFQAEGKSLESAELRKQFQAALSKMGDYLTKRALGHKAACKAFFNEPVSSEGEDVVHVMGTPFQSLPLCPLSPPLSISLSLASLLPASLLLASLSLAPLLLASLSLAFSLTLPCSLSFPPPPAFFLSHSCSFPCPFPPLSLCLGWRLDVKWFKVFSTALLK